MSFKDRLRELVVEAMYFAGKSHQQLDDDIIDSHLHKFGEFFQSSLRFDYQITARMAEDAEITLTEPVIQPEIS